DQAVVRGVEDVMQGNRQLDHAQPGAKMAAGDGDGVNGLLAQFVGELAQLPALQAAQVRRGLDEVEQGGLGWLGQGGNSTGEVGIKTKRSAVNNPAATKGANGDRREVLNVPWLLCLVGRTAGAAEGVYPYCPRRFSCGGDHRDRVRLWCRRGSHH